jgi:tRNA (guanine10-N2)-methyltransferase
VPPKKPYSFLAMLDDILAFAAATLVDNGRLSFWMPTANDESQEIPMPTHPTLELVAVCVQKFNKCKPQLNSFAGTDYPRSTDNCRNTVPLLFLNSSRLTHQAPHHLTLTIGSRRLITYRRRPDQEIPPAALEEYQVRKAARCMGKTVDDLNPFRRGYFRKFESEIEKQ